jgi:histidinol phosphatase-like enzyme (inositol monophosphatase family)
VNFSFSELLDGAHDLADAAATVTLKHFRCGYTTENKGGGDFDPVTIADRGAEQAMRDIISRKFPEHGIAGEEFENVNENADFVWYLDPIDGTRAFILGLPLWGTLIGLKYMGKPILGLMDQPYTRERFWNDENAAWFRGPNGLSPCRTRSCPDLSQAYLAATTPDMFRDGDKERFEALAGAVRMRRFGGDCYLYCMLALGHLDIVTEACLKPFDIVPLIPIVEKAGGVVAEWGAPGGGRYIACGDLGLLEAARAKLEAGGR